MDGPVATLNVTTAGLHTINVWMREDGARIDRVLLTNSRDLRRLAWAPKRARERLLPDARLNSED